MSTVEREEKIVGLSDALKALRTYNQYYQHQVATMLGISRSFVSEIEAGITQPSLGTIQRYCEIFQLTLSDFFHLVAMFNPTVCSNFDGQKVYQWYIIRRNRENEQRPG